MTDSSDIAHLRRVRLLARSRGRSARALPAVLGALALGLAGACVGEGDSSTVGGEAEVPDSFLVALHTSAGDVTIAFHRAWSPQAVARVHQLARDDHWAGARIYRVNPRYAQFGYTGRPDADSAWVGAGLPDEPVVASNERGTVSFARGGPGTRSVLLFINRSDNTDLDALPWNGVVGFPPVGRVVSGMEIVDAFNGAYGDDPLQWEDSIRVTGNVFLDRRFPGLDSIIGSEIVEDWR